MNASIHKYFQIGTIQRMSHPRREVLQSIHDIASDDFFDAIEVCHFQDDAKRKAARDMLAQTHMRVCYGAQPVLLGNKLNPNAVDEEERVRAERALLDALDEAGYLGAKGIAFLAGKWEKAGFDQAYAQLLKTTRNVCAAARKKGSLDLSSGK